MSEYISKQEAIEAFSDMSDGIPITHGDMISDTTAVNVIKSISSADVRPNIHGYWIHDNNPFKDIWFCSNCKPFKKAITKKTDFCPDCGAIMDGEPEGRKRG